MTVALMACTSGNLLAQELNTAYYTEDYLYRHNINPAFENEDSYFSVPVVGNVNVGMMGNFGYEELVRENPLYPDRSNKKMTSFLNPYLKEPLKGFASGENKINGEMKVTVLSMGFKKWNGYNTVELNMRGQANVNVPYKFFQFASEARNNNYDIGDISMAAQAFSEISFGHSRQYDDKWRFGAKVKLLVGLADAQVTMEDVMADLSDASKWKIRADAESHVSKSGFKYLSKTKTYNHSSETYQHINDVEVGGLGVSGFGAAIDLGAVYKFNEDLVLSAAVRDLGGILWTSDFYASNDVKSFVFDGFHDVSADSSSPDKLDYKADNYANQLLDFANLRDKGDNGSRITGIGATLTAGLEYTIPVYRILKVGVNGTAKLNGPYTWSEVRLGGNISPVKWFDGALSLAVNNYTANFGFLANFHGKHANFFIGMDRLLGKVSSEFIPLSSNGNIVFGLNILL